MRTRVSRATAVAPSSSTLWREADSNGGIAARNSTTCFARTVRACKAHGNEAACQRGAETSLPGARLFPLERVFGHLQGVGGAPGSQHDAYTREVTADRVTSRRFPVRYEAVDLLIHLGCVVKTPLCIEDGRELHPRTDRRWRIVRKVHSSVDLDDGPDQLLGLDVAALLAQHPGKNPENSSSVRMIFADQRQAAEQRAPDIDFAFGDPALLGFDPPLEGGVPIDRIFQRAARRRCLILRYARERVPVQIGAAVISLFGVRKPPVRFKDSAVAVLDLCVPIGGVHPEILPLAALRQQREIALQVGFSPRHIAQIQITDHHHQIEIEQATPVLVLEVAHLPVHQFDRAPVLARDPQQSDQIVFIAADLVDIVCAPTCSDGGLRIGGGFARAPERGARLRAAVEKFCKPGGALRRCRICLGRKLG